MTRTLAALAAVVAFALAAAPAAAQRDVPPRFFGVNFDAEILEAPAQVADAEFELQRSSGVETTRTIFSWSRAQPVKDAPPDWSRIDPMVARASLQGIELLPIVMEAPPWARERRGVLHSPPKHPRHMASFLRLLIERYGPDGDFWAENPDVPNQPLRTWQIWNEPHLRFQWDSKKPWAKPYANQLRWAYKAIKRADPGAKVVLASLANTSWRHLAELYRRGIRRYYDIGALHPFTTKAKNVIVLARRFRAVMRRYRDSRKPLWITELGLPASKGVHDSDRTLQTTDEGMADFLTTAMEKIIAGRRSRHVRVSRVYWYTWASTYCCTDIFRWSGLRSYDQDTQTFGRKPAYFAWLDIARRHQGCEKAQTAVCGPGEPE